jgi:hypothetical protein
VRVVTLTHGDTTMEKRHYEVIVPGVNGSFFYDIPVYDRIGVGDVNNNRLKEAAEKAVREAKLTTPRKNPQSIEVQVIRLEIQDGKLQRTPNKVRVQPPLAKMTKAEYDEEMAEVVKDLPEEFRQFVIGRSYEDGHSSGYEEVINYAVELTDALTPCVTAYTNRIWSRCHG